MRTVDNLLALEEIPTLLQYLYLDESHYITVDNGLAKLELRMTENFSVHAKNLNFPDLPDLNYDDMMNIPNMLGIIEQLKESPAVEYKSQFNSRWEEINTITNANVGQNKFNRATIPTARRGV